jgi:hypothetical protein
VVVAVGGILYADTLRGRISICCVVWLGSLTSFSDLFYGRVGCPFLFRFITVVLY